MTEPFLFWGRAPSDWLEGANDGHAYEVRFVEPPTREQRIAIAKAFFAAMKKGPATAAERDWLWAGSWTILFVGEKKAGNGRGVFDHMASVFRAVHEVHPIAEVVFWNARSPGEDPWDRATREQSSAPTPGPAWAGLVPMGLYGRARDGSLGAGESDADFELARTGKKAKATKGAPSLKLTNVLPGVAGHFSVAANEPLATTLPGDVRAVRTLGDGARVALTTEGLFLVDRAGVERARVDAAGAVQLAVTPKRVAVTMGPNAEIRAYRIGPASLELVGEVRAKKGGPLWANGDRVFFVNVATYTEISGWPEA